MKTDVNGCSTCLPGQESYEIFEIKTPKGTLRRFQYDYRHTNGMLFSCIAKSLDEARGKAALWIVGGCIT